MLTAVFICTESDTYKALQGSHYYLDGEAYAQRCKIFCEQSESMPVAG